MEKLLLQTSELLSEIRRHRATTMSQTTFREKARDLALLWYEVKTELDCPEEISELDQRFDSLRILAGRRSLTHDYRVVLEDIEERLFRCRARAKSCDPLSVISKSLSIHQRIAEVSGSLFRPGHYTSAVLEAFKAVNNAVKAKSGRTDLDGADLMAQVFNENTPILKINDLSDQSDKDEQKGFRFIFMGSVTGIRNPNAHEIARLADPIRAMEMLVLASLLMKIVDESSL